MRKYTIILASLLFFLSTTYNGGYLTAEPISASGNTVSDIDFQFGRILQIVATDFDGQTAFAIQNLDWGVLALNTDKSIYEPLETARFTLAVLDENGSMVCDADMEVDIISQEAGFQKTLSTRDGTIRINPECQIHDKVDEADFTAELEVGGVGVYTLEFTAETKNGVQKIQDTFEVRGYVPFVVERIGPTRIYPPKPYEMWLVIRANEDFNGEIQEEIPQNFSLRSTNAHQVQQNQNVTLLKWREHWQAGETHILYYEFEMPFTNPEFYLLGPLQIGRFTEVRQWQLAIDDTGEIDPDGDGTVGGLAVTCGGGGNYACLDDSMRDPTAPSTGGDFVDLGNNAQDFYEMGTISGIDIVTQVVVHVYHQEMKNNMLTSVSLWDTDEITQYGTTTDLPRRLSAQWDSVTFTGLSLLQSQLDTLNVRLRCYKSSSGSPGNCQEYAMYATVTSTPLAVDPTFTQNNLSWYVDNDLVNPTDIWGIPNLSENEPIAITPAGLDPPGNTQELRLRINFTVNTVNLSASSKQFKLQFKTGTDGNCTTGSWTDVGVGQAWEFASSGVTDGADITGVLSDTNVAEEYAKSNPTETNHNSASIGQKIEYDFHIVGANAAAATRYSFRAVESDNTVFDAYTNCPTLTTEPIMQNFMRHGDIFTPDNGMEQGFFWAE